MKRILFGFIVASVILFSGQSSAIADLFNKELVLVQQMAEKGDPAAQLEMGNRYKAGRNGVQQDYTQALSWFQKAAEQKHTAAYLPIAQMILDGDGVEKSPVKAADWVRKAADKGDVLGWVALGRMHMDGVGVLQNDTKALKWFRKASIYDLPKAEFFMGFMYEKGRGVETNLVMAHAWYRLVARGNPASSYKQDHREMLKAKLTPEQLEEAERMSEDIKATQKALPDKYR